MSGNKAMVAKEEMMSALVNPEYTGNSTRASLQFPPVINILQSDKQYEAFGEDKNKITMGMYGKLFIRKQEGNEIGDLVDEIRGTILKIETGHEIYKIDDRGKPTKIVESHPITIPKGNANEWAIANPGRIYKNMIKVVLLPEDNEEEVLEMLEAGVNPFCMLTIKGSGWGNWFEVQKEMNSIAMASAIYGHKSANDLLVSVFKLVIKSEKQNSIDGKYSYYIPSMSVILNTPEFAFSVNEYVWKLKDLSLFNKVAEQVEKRERAKAEVVDNSRDVEDIIGV